MFQLEEIDFQITNECPLQCRHCCCSSSPKAGTIWTKNLAFDLLNQAVELGCKEVHLTGGEPLIRSDVFSIIDYAKSIGLYVQLQSSGAIIDTDIIAQLKRLNLDLFMISLDGYQQNHDFYRGTGSFKKTLQRLKLLVEMGIPVRVNSIITKRNMDDLSSLIDLTASLGVQAHSFFYFSPIGRGSTIAAEWLPPMLYRKVVSELRNHVITKGTADRMAVFIQDGFGDSQNDLHNTVLCRAQRRTFLVILANGSVLPCTWFINTEKTLGNVRIQTLAEIWKNFTEGRSFFSTDPEECSSCNVFFKCRGGCQAASLMKYKKLPRKDPRCDSPSVYYPGCPERKVRVKGQKRVIQFGRLKEAER